MSTLLPADPLKVSLPCDGVALLEMNRPEARNALDLALRERIATTLSALADDDGVRVAVMTGSPKVFAAGADVKWLADIGSIDHVRGRYHRYWDAIAEFPKPLISAVEGYALGGGCELALHSDIIVAAETARFGQPEIKLGLMPGAGGTQRLLRSIGRYKTMLLVLDGDAVTAQEAFTMGFVSKVVPQGAALETALDLAKRIARHSPLAVQLIKSAIRDGENTGLDTALVLERRGFQLLLGSEDKHEGINAFLAKSEPTFRGT